MTRQIFILILSISAVIIGGVWETKYLQNSCNFVLSDIEYMENVLNNNNLELADNQLNEIEKSWNNVKDSWNIFVQNDLIDQIDDSLIELKAYYEVKNMEETIVVLKKLRGNLQDIVGRQKLCFENIF